MSPPFLVYAARSIFMLLKFCDPHAFDYPYLKECLDREGIKNMLIEMDDQQQSLGQLSTRLETFIQMIWKGLAICQTSFQKKEK